MYIIHISYSLSGIYFEQVSDYLIFYIPLWSISLLAWQPVYMVAGVYPPLWYHLAQNRDRAGVTLLTHVNTHA